MKVNILIVGQLMTNCYLVNDANNNCLIIDPADDAEYIINRIKDLELNPKAIIATHGHFDHILAVNELKLAYNIPFFLHEKDEKFLKWTRKSTMVFTRNDPGPAPKVDKYIKEKNLKINSFEFEIILTPGHTPGSISFYNKKSKTVFVGDVIFEHGGVGRTDLPYSNTKDLIQSIKRLNKLPLNTTVYSGHGNPFFLKNFNKSFYV